MGTEQIRFAVIYRWRIRAGFEDRFVAAWEILTRGIRAERRGLGSRLHRADDGTWVAYAQWPDRRAWENMQDLDSVDAGASADLKMAVAERFEPILLEPARDLLASD